MAKGIGDVALTRQMTLNNLRTEKSYKDMATSLTTQRKAAQLQDLPDAYAFQNLEVRDLGIEQFQNNIKQAQTRLGFMSAQIKGIVDKLTDFRARATAACDPSLKDTGFQTFCRGLLEEVESALNATDAEGRSLFGGEQTTGKVVDIGLLPTPGPGDTPVTSYYLGNSTELSIDGGDTSPLTYGIPGNEMGFARILHILKIGSVTPPDHTPANMDRIREALTHSNAATYEIAEILNRIGDDVKFCEGKIETLDQDLLYVREQLEDMNGVNTAEAYTIMMQLDAQFKTVLQLMRQVLSPQKLAGFME